MTVVRLLEGLDGLYLLALERTALLQRLYTLPGPLAPAHRPTALAVLVTSAVLMLYAALAAGPDPTVRVFRALALLSAACIPLLAVRLVGTEREPVFMGSVLVLLVFSGVLNRVLARRRRESLSSRAIQRARWGVEVAGFLLFAAGCGLLFAGHAVPLRLAFWALFLLRLSVADLLDPANLAREVGLPRSAARDIRTAVAPKGKRRRPSAGRRLGRAITGLGKALLLVLWLALPLAAALARGELPVLALYPVAALLASGLFLLYRGAGDARDAPLDAARGLAAGLGTLLYLVFAYSDPAFAAYQRSLPGLVLAEVLFGFLLGAAGRGRQR